MSAGSFRRASGRLLGIVLGVLAGAGAVASAQRPDSSLAARQDLDDARLTCASSGLTLRAWTGPGDAPAMTRVAPTPRSGVLDTTIVLSIADRRWQRDNVDAGVALGAAGTAGTAGAANRPWHACAGATVHLGGVTAQLHNVAGNIHFRADLSALDSVGRTRSSTPPAGPPRR
jgi:hypothetical protein